MFRLRMLLDWPSLCSQDLYDQYTYYFLHHSFTNLRIFNNLSWVYIVVKIGYKAPNLTNLTINQLLKHIQIEEETHIRKNNFNMKFGSNKVKVIETSISKIKNIMERREHLDAETSSIFKKHNSCYLWKHFCGKEGHFKKECKFFKKGKTENYTNRANMVE